MIIRIFEIFDYQEQRISFSNINVKQQFLYTSRKLTSKFIAPKWLTNVKVIYRLCEFSWDRPFEQSNTHVGITIRFLVTIIHQYQHLSSNNRG